MSLIFERTLASGFGNAGPSAEVGASFARTEKGHTPRLADRLRIFTGGRRVWPFSPRDNDRQPRVGPRAELWRR